MHAYLIIAHHYFDLLKQLLAALDDPRNDIYIHVDKKAASFSSEDLTRVCQNSQVTFVNRYSILWGGYSMVQAEYALLSSALQSGKNYTYYHLLSGVDIPLVNQNDMHDFFDAHQGKEFVSFAPAEMNPTELARVQYYHFFPGRRNLFNRLLTKGESVLQHFLGVNRLRGRTVYRGGQWFSITAEFAAYLLAHKKDVDKNFRHTLIPDEFFVQTLLAGSPFRKRLYYDHFDDNVLSSMRLTDWKRGNPYTFTNADYDMIVDSGCLFARKFSPEVDPTIIERLYARLK
ncbi:MAG: glycosyl transferase [Clostridiales bacterium]|nr:glycosyl transferase [Clostridiales bacterium]